MKRFGYTLAEALIAMTVVGLIAAITMPLVSKFKPDTNKVLYLKTYDAIVEATQMMTTSSNLYPMIQQENGGYINYKDAPLANLVQVEVNDTGFGGTNAKYCQILAYALGSTSDKCDSGIYPMGNDAFWGENGLGSYFISQNGVYFETYTKKPMPVGSTVSYQTDIYFDVDGIERGKNCIYDEDTCTQPDRFKLMVASDGKIVAADPKGRAYLAKRSTFKLNKDEKCDDKGILAYLPNGDLYKTIIIETSGVEGNQPPEDPAKPETPEDPAKPETPEDPAEPKIPTGPFAGATQIPGGLEELPEEEYIGSGCLACDAAEQNQDSSKILNNDGTYKEDTIRHTCGKK